MKRKLLSQLVKWYDEKPNIPLLLQGPKGVGKTRLIFDFIKTYDENKIYINFEQNPMLIDLFKYADESLVIQKVSEYFHIDSTFSTIIVLDEINYCTEIFELLSCDLTKYPQLKFILISSSNTLSMDQKIYKKLTRLRLYPLDFEEFLDATGYVWYISVIREHYISNQPIPDILHEELLDLFDEYLMVGGMPLAVNEYIALNSALNISEQHMLITNHYFNSLKNNLTEGEYLKACQLYQTIDQQLSKKNKKFQYNLIRKGATKKIYETAMSTLTDDQFFIKCLKFKPSQLDDSSKIYLFDTGLLLTKAKKSMFSTIVENDSVFNRGLLENYIAVELHSKGYPLYYWESNSQAKIDFIINKEGIFLPIEVRETNNTRSKALSIFKTVYPTEKSIKISPKNFSYHNNIKYLPLYATFCI